MEMKDGDYYCRLCRKYLFLALLLILTILLLLDRENYPSLFTHLSSHDVSAIPPSEPRVQNEDGKFQSLVNEETREPIEEVPKDDNDENGTSITETKVCNYAKGRWVADSGYPLYSAGCKYIQRNWACRLTNRTDFSYEGYRWQPRDCSMPKFDPSAFLARMRDKTIAFIGDSLSREQFQSLMCMLTGGKDSPDVEDVASKYDFLLFLHRGAVHHHGWAYRFQSTNTTIILGQPDSAPGREPINATDPNTLYAMHLDRQPAFIQDHINDLDVLVLNTARHWSLRMVNMDKEIMYLNGKPLKDKNLRKIESAKIFKVNNIVKWLHSQIILHVQS
ncbi:hypothetical protein SLEP1_g31562 [Rubroshorea leprosula]|uniref:Trichome birefringence-like N-terminal domain-containing protein n=1 Tax=Rubroshorea leprosula TaxID=152421 RepID=A0AAV5K5U9_9ROSI|nr:hypothetical protein SLEP1_g31562 [Rubroshorea leprosula]